MNTLPAGAKCGFLVKRAVKSGGNWKRRFFVLGENSLTYYTDEAGARRGTSPKGDILFTADSTVSPRDVESIAFCFAIVTPEKTLYVAAQGEAEMADWIAAVRASIEALSTSAHRGKRGYLAKRAVVSGGNWKRRFFLLLSSDRLSCCAYYNDETALLQPKVRLNSVRVVFISNRNIYKLATTGNWACLSQDDIGRVLINTTHHGASERQALVLVLLRVVVSREDRDLVRRRGVLRHGRPVHRHQGEDGEAEKAANRYSSSPGTCVFVTRFTCLLLLLLLLPAAAAAPSPAAGTAKLARVAPGLRHSRLRVLRPRTSCCCCCFCCCCFQLRRRVWKQQQLNIVR